MLVPPSPQHLLSVFLLLYFFPLFFYFLVRNMSIEVGKVCSVNICTVVQLRGATGEVESALKGCGVSGT